MVSGRYIELVTVYNVVKLNQFEYPLVTTYWYGLIIPAQRVHVIIVLLREKHEVLGGTGKKNMIVIPKKVPKSQSSLKIYIYQNNTKIHCSIFFGRVTTFVY